MVASREKKTVPRHEAGCVLTKSFKLDNLNKVKLVSNGHSKTDKTKMFRNNW